jgi:chromodomain-helicase-DNA-binding protein 4
LIDFDDTPVKGKKKSNKSKSIVSDESDGYTGSAFGVSDGEDTDDAAPLTSGELLALTDEAHTKNETPKRTNIKGAVPKNIAGTSNTDTRYRDAAPLSPIHNTKHNGYETGNPICSLCGIRHGDDACYMTESSENLAEYRQMLMLHADDEPIEDRVITYTLLYVLQPTLIPTCSKQPSESSMRHCTSGGKCT